jgi:hypothetical protein
MDDVIIVMSPTWSSEHHAVTERHVQFGNLPALLVPIPLFLLT